MVVTGNRPFPGKLAWRTFMRRTPLLWWLLVVQALLGPSVSHSQQQGPSEEVATGELILHYAYVTPPKQAVSGKAIDTEYAKAAEVALEGLGLPADQVQIEPLFNEIVEEMRSKGQPESLAILSLIERYNTTSDRFLNSIFFSRIQKRPYNFAQVVVIKFPMPAKMKMDQVFDSIRSRRSRQRARNLIITPLPINLTPVVGSRVDGDDGVAPKQLGLCEKNAPKVTIIGDQFIPRADLPQMHVLSDTAPNANGCDKTPYAKSTESYGTNLSGLVATSCPTCPIIGIDAGCPRNSTAFLRSSDVMRALLSAIVRDVSIVVFTTAERTIDPLFASIISAALDARVLLVAPAGDRSSKEGYHPAATSGVFGVGAIGSAGSRAPFSNYGPWVVTSSRGESMTTLHGPTGFVTLSSTSVAAAHFAGLLGRYLALNPKAPIETLPAVIATKEFMAPSAQSCPERPASGSGQGSSTPSGSGGSASPGTAPGGSAGGAPSAGSADPSAPSPVAGGNTSIPPEQPRATDIPDACPSDPTKTQPGLCGCGVAEGSCATSEDLCPDDPAKTKPGVCGCGKLDHDLNKNNTVDCLENSQFLGKSNNDSPFKSEPIATTDNQANKVIAFELNKEEKILTDLLKTLGVPASRAPTLEAGSAVVPKDTKLNLVVDYAKARVCVNQTKASGNPFAELFESKTFAANVSVYGQAKLSVGAEPFKVPKDTTVGALRAAISSSSCPGAIIGVTDPTDSVGKVYANGSFNDPAAARQRDYLEATKFEKAYEYFKKNSSSSVVVAFIDTGFD